MRCVCIHAHFYQPPREDPWLDEVLSDASAAPYHDWNARINAECYRPNRAARLTDGNGRIVSIVNNYRYLSFNVGPTLHRWMARHDHVLATRIRTSDEEATREFGAGNAIAQGYNHMILPLASARDKRTQVRWGAVDFRSRFGRNPVGMWLPETAVDTMTLEALATEGVAFTILAPWQCASVRSPSGEGQKTPGGTGLDTSRPYRVALPSGKSIVVVFYSADIARDIAFGGLLDNGDRLAEALLRSVPDNGEPRLVVIATDGESYGHHHRFGEMALARAFQVLSSSRDVSLSNIDAFLARHPATWEATIAENTSWSCAHGVERWRSDCGCHTGGEHGWHQRWRGPLRHALDRLREKLDDSFEANLAPFTQDPWALRNEAIALHLDQGAETPEAFLAARFGKSLREEDTGKILLLLEAQRMGMFMYTSCGWFFNDLAGIETVQILSYAYRALELLREAGGPDLEESFRSDLRKAEGNRPELPRGDVVLDQLVLPSRRSLRDVATQAALLGVSSSYYAFTVDQTSHTISGGDLFLRLSDLSVEDHRTNRRWKGSACVLSSGGLGDVCRLREDDLPPLRPFKRLFYEGDLLELSRQMENHFPLGPWKLGILPQDDREMVARERSIEAEERWSEQTTEITDESKRLLVQLHSIGVSAPPFLRAAAELSFRSHLQELVEASSTVLDLLSENSPLETLLEEAHSMGLEPELSVLAPHLARELHNALRAQRNVEEEAVLRRVLAHLERIRELHITLDLWRIQNEMWRLLESEKERTSGTLLNLAAFLGFAVPESSRTVPE